MEVAEAAVNHKSVTLDGIAGVYVRHDYVDESAQRSQPGLGTSKSLAAIRGLSYRCGG
jgi:hypothetical protein